MSEDNRAERAVRARVAIESDVAKMTPEMLLLWKQFTQHVLNEPDIMQNVASARLGRAVTREDVEDIARMLLEHIDARLRGALMAVAVYKYGLNLGVNDIKMPSGAQILSTGYQGSAGLVIWALVNTSPNWKEVTRRVAVLFTGAELPPGCAADFIGTATSFLGLVYHAFDLGEVP